ncbi:DUF3088 domain-containing protein [Burkholderia pseudomallei]|nr:DUF3088 domain-containing protein [Burkholderia pseudomallei]MBG1249252.1 DUF3088 domain-containing protein [Burkholderia pseudomallei]
MTRGERPARPGVRARRIRARGRRRTVRTPPVTQTDPPGETTVKDKRFILRPGFYDGAQGPFYRGDSVAVEGLLSCFAPLRDAVDVEYIDAPRPRHALVALIGEAHQSAPVIVLGAGRTPKAPSIAVREHDGTRFIDSPADIRRYLSSQYGVAHAS